MSQGHVRYWVSPWHLLGVGGGILLGKDLKVSPKHGVRTREQCNKLGRGPLAAREDRFDAGGS